MMLARKKKIYLILVLFLLIVGGIGAVIFYKYYNLYFRPNTAFDEEKRLLDIPRGTTFAMLPDLMQRQGMMERPDLLQTFIEQRGLLDRSASGRYTITHGMTTRAVVNLIASRRQTPVRLVVPSVRTHGEMAGRLAAQLELDSVFILSALHNSQLAEEYQLSSEELPAIIIPNTYEVYWDITIEKLFDRFHMEWKRFWGEQRTRKAEEMGLAPVEVSTLASIIQEEVMQSSELPIIAGVYMNRLRANMPLQACPTAKFAAGDMSLSRILKAHTEIVSPYNTYLNLGLPPGPIRYPSIQAIDAVLNYQQHDFFYFCAKEDFSGYHHFSRTGLQHAAHARRYQQELNRRGIR